MFESFIGVNFWTALFVLLNTLLLLFASTKFLFIPVKTMIDDRQKEIDGLYESAGTAKAEAEALRRAYQEKLSDANAASQRIVSEAAARGQRREEEILRKASEDAAAILQKASADIALEKKKALSDAKNEISGLALAIAGKIVERELTSHDQTRFIDSFLDSLGDGL